MDGKSAMSPGRGARMGNQTTFVFRRYAAWLFPPALPTAGAVGYFPSLLRSYSFGHSTENVEEAQKLNC